MERKYINLAAAAAMMLGTTTAMARPRGAASSSSTSTSTQGSCGQHMEKIKAALNQLTDLSTNQKSQINNIMANAKSAKAANKAAAATGTGTATKGEGREMVKQIVSVLTSPQATKFKQLMKSEKRK